ncbi:MmgE/PrpD family protein [Streptomyces sp. NPDC056983]|uniref:MmgE/PrpD family protein n=1 Tax=Streptomyces sp. NPDC056983 TaxID=3345987 RepID=UPI0036451BD6
MSSSPTHAIAEYAASTSLGALPHEVREQAKQVIFDEMASAHFGRQQPAGTLAARYVASLSGPQESQVLGSELRTSAPLAALANGTAGHADEIDGTHVVGGHPGATLVHATVALAEREGATGGDLLNAVVLGYDVGVRLIAACGGMFEVKERHHLNADFLHALGAAVACCRIMGLDPEHYRHAMALATFQANGLRALFRERQHLSKAFCNGQYAMAGVSSALQAATGFEGCDDVLGERHGVFDAWGADDAEATVTRGLGSDFAVMGANFKFIRAGQPIHAPVEAALSLVARHDIKVDAISSVEVGMPARPLRVVDNRRMHNICAQDMIAAALLRGGLPLHESPFPAVLDDPSFEPLRSRITLVVNPLLEMQGPDNRGAVVTITTRDGQRVTERVDHPLGHSNRGGATWDDLTTKWRAAAPDHDVDSWLAHARKLEDLQHAEQLSGVFAR